VATLSDVSSLSNASTGLDHEARLVPFHTYIVKIASRCNLNCSYCFVYNQADHRWQAQPKFMALETLRTLCDRIAEHCLEFNKTQVSVIFHGGEPLLVGPKRLSDYASLIHKILSRNGVDATLGMQSNGTLFTDLIGDVCLVHKISMGISIDGPPYRNDIHRVDHGGRGSSARLEAGLRILTSPRYRSIFSGFLSVVDLETDPVELFEYLATFSPPSIDILLPYDNHDRLPKGKQSPLDTHYGAWMRHLFDHWWYATDGSIGIRSFKSLVRLLIGAESLVESLGLDVVDLVVVETNGDIEAVDSLKATFEGATRLGFDVFSNSFTEVARAGAVRARQMGATSLCATCQQCPHVSACGGGYMPNRYSSKRGFDNVSVYCGDMQMIISRIQDGLDEAVAAARR
jgi:uncharacterized protein